MSDPTNSRRQSGVQRTAEGILIAATGLFAAHEHQRVTVEQIAAEAEVAIGSIYVHYGSKERLYLAVVERALEVCLGYTGQRKSSPSPVARMKHLGEAFVEFALSHPDEFRIVSERATQRVDIPDFAELEARIRELVQRDIFQLAADAHAAIQAGEIRDMPIQQVVAYFWALWSGMIAMTTRADAFRLAPEQLRPMLADAADVLERGLAPAHGAIRSAPEGGRHAA